MNKIIVVGHPQSDHEDVLRLLSECGMASALPSRRDNLTPAQISATLVKAHGAVPIAQVQFAEQLQQIKVAPVWQGMVLDLMLSNLDQPFWGWADTQAVYLLDYWKEQDPQVVFVLVYDEPQTVYTRLSLAQAAASQEELKRHMAAWVAYNAALLHFHLRNPERSLLVHSQQVKPSAQSYLQHVSARINAPLLTPSGLLQAHDTADVAPGELVSDRPLVGKLVQQSRMDNASDLPLDAHVELLADLLMDAYPQAKTLYEELQAAATLPFGMAGNRGQAAGKAFALQGFADGAQTLYRAWQACVAQYQLEQNQSHNAKAMAAQIQKLQTGQQIGVQENRLLLAQLHEVQKELERRYLQSKQQAEELKTLQEKTEQLSDATVKIKQLQAECEAMQKQPASTELRLENEFLLIQLHKVQEELEHYYLENCRIKSNPKSKPKAHYGAAERVKQQLSYRLGSIMISRSRSVGGWLSMPFALHAETRHFRKEMAARKGEKLPPIAQYRDIHEAERIKQHLSYRLGATLIAGSKSVGGWFSLPKVLYVEARDFKRKRQQ